MPNATWRGLNEKNQPTRKNTQRMFTLLPAAQLLTATSACLPEATFPGTAIFQGGYCKKNTEIRLSH